MATNTLKAPVANQKEEKKTMFTSLENGMKMTTFFQDGIPVQYLPQVLFVSFLLIVYIGNSHYAERTIRQTDKLKTEVDDLRADYTTLKADLMYSSKQSEVAKKVYALGLEESLRPPYKLIIPQE